MRKLGIALADGGPEQNWGTQCLLHAWDKSSPFWAEWVSLAQGTKKLLDSGMEQANLPHSPPAVMEGSEAWTGECRRNPGDWWNSKRGRGPRKWNNGGPALDPSTWCNSWHQSAHHHWFWWVCVMGKMKPWEGASWWSYRVSVRDCVQGALPFFSDPDRVQFRSEPSTSQPLHMPRSLARDALWETEALPWQITFKRRDYLSMVPEPIWSPGQ